MATTDIFNRDVSNLAGVFTSDRAKLTFMNGLNTLIQRMQVSYSQTITRLFEVGSSSQYYIGGRTMGQATIDRVVGPSASVMVYYSVYGDVCGSRGRSMNFSLQETNCSNSQATALTNGSGSGNTTPLAQGSTQTTISLVNVVITQLGIGVTSQEMIISDNTQLMFTSLRATQGQNSAASPAADATIGISANVN